MSFLTGSQKTVQTEAYDPLAQETRGRLNSFLQGVDPLTGLSTGANQIPPALMQLFSSSLSPVLAQAKESAGSISGSGLGNILGATAGRSLNDFLFRILSERGARATALSGAMIRPLGQQTYHQPGFLDYLFQGASLAAPFLARSRTPADLSAPDITPPEGLSNIPVGIGPGYPGYN